MTPEEHAEAHKLGLPHTHDEHAGGHGAQGCAERHAGCAAVLNRMSRLIGHLEKVKRMVEAGDDCSDVLIQLSAVDAALRGVGRIILKDHISHCIVDAAQDGDDAAIERLNKAIDQFLK